ncbi:MAG: 4Fe-4S dicluster domain-containing protein, partial [Symbiobacteriaceae bacterium]|nr:4Fe-4S dicluster domain-containing protein [Symbiobacteriaceae bacterium]
MAYHLDKDAVEELLLRLQREYRIFAPKRFPKQGRFSDTDVIRYAELGRELTGYADFELSARSTYSAKEVVTPINQTIFHFTPEEYRESRITNDRPILVFLRPCDIHAFEHQDKIYLENGASEDSFYGRIRAKLRFVLIECAEGFDTCFCVSMGSNRSDNFAMAVRQEQDGLSILVKDPALLPYFDGESEYYFTPRFVESNPTKVVLPQIPNQEALLALKKHPMWDEYDSRCISCGSCTVACSTCTCFSTRDIAYTQNADAGERRRVTASCQVEGFDEMA